MLEISVFASLVGFFLSDQSLLLVKSGLVSYLTNYPLIKKIIYSLVHPQEIFLKKSFGACQAIFWSLSGHKERLS